MEAKGTVVHADGCATNLGVIGATCNCGAELQAEISFKAGIREVVEWILAHSQLERCGPDVMAYFIDYLAIDYPDWQAKLKEWGIKDG